MKSPILQLLIVDDEELARVELSRQVKLLLPTSVHRQASNIHEARELLLSNHFDAVFLDLEMPNGHGLSFLPEIRTMGFPVIITTAHEQFALAAYDLDVADYLLKPIEESRLSRALSRIRSHHVSKACKLIVFSDQNCCWPLHPEDIIMAQSDGSYVTLHVKNRSPILLSRGLKDIEHLLCEKHFVRANRSQIVQLGCLKTIHRTEGGCLTAQVGELGKIEFSRRQSQTFRQRFAV